MIFDDNHFSHLRNEEIAGKKVYVTDRHQYVMPLWTAHSNMDAASYELVSIDFHPDTNPPFWQVLTLEATLANREEDEAYFQKLLERKLSKIDRNDLDQIVDLIEELNNDEHINTAMALGVLRDYHMINCMDAHAYERGKHYLLTEAHYGSLEDAMFESVDFKVPSTPFILDIDLDYFMRRTDFIIKNDTIFEALVEGAEFITIARSVKYFEYLKKESFSIDECEDLLLDLLRTYLEK